MASINGKATAQVAKHWTIEIPVGLQEDGETMEIVTARLRQPGLNIFEDVTERCPVPEPPRIPLRDKKGLIRENGRPVYDVNDRDPRWKASRNQALKLQTVGAFLELLDDPSWELDTERPDADADTSAWTAYYESVLVELEAFGLTTRSFSAIGDAVKKASGATEEQIAEAEATFS